MAYIGSGISRFNTADELTVTGDAQIDTTTLVVDSTNNRVGIGTASPATALDVTGTINVGDNHTIGDDVNDNLTISSSSGEFVIIEGDGGFLLRQGASATNAIRVASGGDISFYADNGTTQGLLWDASTQRLGLGTTAPARQLHLQSASGGGMLSVEKTSSTTSAFVVAADSGEVNLFARDTNSGTGNVNFGFNTGNTRRMTITSSGSVGIGTSSPSSLLDVDKSQNAETNIELTNTNVGSAAQVRTKYTTDGGLFTVGKVSDAHAYSGAAYLWNVDNTGMLFATNDTERMRLDASGNLLVGTTSTISSNTNGGLYVSNAGYTSLFNRESSAGDGNIMLFAKGGTTVGLIGVYGSRIYAGTGDVGLWFNDQSDYIAPINAGTSALRDAAIDIGHSAYRFKDLYLSGGAYIGGTGSVNYLDDYEEGSGSFTSVTDSSGNALTTSTNVYYYTKVGRFVQLEIRVQLSSATTGEVRLNGPPFTLSSNDTELGVVIDRNVFAASSSQIRLRAGTNNQYMYGVVTYRTS